MMTFLRTLGASFSDLGRNLWTNLRWVGRSFVTFGRDFAAAFTG